MSLGEKSFSLFKREVILYVLQIFTSAVIARVLGPNLLGVALILNMIPTYAETFGRLKFDIAAVVASNDKQRFSMLEEEGEAGGDVTLYIRANQVR